jgi:hypothetical protein
MIPTLAAKDMSGPFPTLFSGTSKCKFVFSLFSQTYEAVFQDSKSGSYALSQKVINLPLVARNGVAPKITFNK